LIVAFVVFAGQSNALGYGMDRSTLPGDAAAPLGSTFIWNNDGWRWEVMQPGVNTGTPAHPQAWGPEVAFALGFRAGHPDEPLYIVKSVKGGTGLAQDPDAMDWSPASRGEMFDLTTQRVAVARATLHGPVVDAVFLFQGEADAMTATAAAAYEANLRDWLAAIRADWMRDPQGEIAFGRISDQAPFVEQVREAQAAVDRDDLYAASFDTCDFAMQDDGLHYAAGAFLEIGVSFYAAFEIGA
jgi:hypothetical protein